MVPGRLTSEFWGKCLVQAVMILNALVLPEGHKIDVSDEFAVGIAAGLEGAYAIARSIVKGFVARAGL